MSSIKFLYKSQYILDNEIKEGSKHSVTSGAVYEALKNVHVSTLFQSGYFTEGIIGVVKQHHLTYADGTLALAQGDKVFVPNYKNEETGDFIFKVYEVPTAVTATSLKLDSYAAAIMVDITTNTFVGETIRQQVYQESVGYLDQAVQRIFAQDTEPAISKRGSDNGTIWWDTSINRMKEYVASENAWVEKEYSIPVGIVSRLNGTITGIQQDFETSGYVGRYFFSHPDLTMIAPAGRTEDVQSTFNSQMFMTTEVLVKDMFEDVTLDEFTNYSLYITTAGEIIGPRVQLVYDKELGYMVDGEGNTYSCCEIATASAKHLTTAVNDPLSITDLNGKGCTTIADSDDIDYLISLIGSSAGLTIDDLTDLIENNREQLEEMLKSELRALKQNIANEVVHKANGDLYKDSLDETVQGVKTFVEKIKGNLNGIADMTTTTMYNSPSSPEIMPSGIAVVNGKAVGNYTDAEKSTLRTQTTVRIGHNYVKATTFQGTATAMQWADLAENYLADDDYTPGTLIRFGGEKEITIASFGVVNGVISSKPAVLMNDGDTGLPVALVGRVPVRVVGSVNKFDPITLCSGIAGVGIKAKYGDVIIARALEDKLNTEEGLVLCVVQMKL